MKKDLMFGCSFDNRLIIGTFSENNFTIQHEYSIEVKDPVEVLREIIELFSSHFYEKHDDLPLKEIYLKKDARYKWILEISLPNSWTRVPSINIGIRYENSVESGYAYREQFSCTACNNDARFFLRKLREYRKMLMEDD